MSISDIAQTIKDSSENIYLLYAFNGMGKTQLSVRFKDITKREDGTHTGFYYNAFSEDLFVWDNDEDHDNLNIRLKILESSLTAYHSYILETSIVNDQLVYPIDRWLSIFSPRYTYKINRYYLDEKNTVVDEEKGIESFSFYQTEDEEQQVPIKISRGEERTFVWCFYLALFEHLAPDCNYLYIDDPVSSLDDHNVFLTFYSLVLLMRSYYGNDLDFSKESNKTKKFIVSTHHIGFASIISNWLGKGEFQDKFKKKHKTYLLSNKNGSLELVSTSGDVLLYHLRLLQIIGKALKNDEPIQAYHVALLRQLLENISSFLGAGYFSYSLKDIGYSDEEASLKALQINSLTHQDIYSPSIESIMSDEDIKRLVGDIYDRITSKYLFITHVK